MMTVGCLMRKTALWVAIAVVMPVALSAQALEINISYIRQKVDRPPVLSNLDPIPEDDGQAGAIVGHADNATTGRFLNQDYRLSFFEMDDTGAVTPVDGAGTLQTPGDLVLMDAPTSSLLIFADRPENAGKLIFNVARGDAALRDTECRANILHTAVSDAMRSDALAQFLVLRRWSKLVMIEGRRHADKAFADAIRNSAAKFRLKIAATKEWVSDADLRRTASSELPPFTQDFPKHDVLIVADETDDFARYLPYNTWQARPVVGSAGLVPTAWSSAVESWGAAQLQSRFEESAGRDMRPLDYAAWAAIRSIGEAVTRLNSADAGDVRAFILSDAFELSGFKGRKLSFRNWNGQMRQVVHLVHPRAVVANAPLPGFLHRVTELDTLGLDEPESKCGVFGE